MNNDRKPTLEEYQAHIAKTDNIPFEQVKKEEKEWLKDIISAGNEAKQITINKKKGKSLDKIR